jgi:hypothetical protein
MKLMTKAEVEETLAKIHAFEREENEEENPNDYWYLYGDFIVLLYENTYLQIDPVNGMYEFPVSKFAHILNPGWH